MTIFHIGQNVVKLKHNAGNPKDTVYYVLYVAY